MFTNGEKVTLGLAGLMILGGAVIEVFAYGKSQYYQGRLDMIKEVRKEFVGIKDELEKNKEEA